MTPDQTANLKKFNSCCTCGGTRKGKDKNIHSSWCPQYAEYKEWRESMPLVEVKGKNYKAQLPKEDQKLAALDEYNMSNAEIAASISSGKVEPVDYTKDTLPTLQQYISGKCLVYPDSTFEEPLHVKVQEQKLGPKLPATILNDEQIKQMEDAFEQHKSAMSKALEITKSTMFTPRTKESDPTGADPKRPGAKLDAGKAPLRRGLLEYFPRACLAVAEVSASGANKYTWDGWQSVPNGTIRYGDAELRHVVKAAIEGPIDSDFGHLHAAHEAWNALARLELILRQNESNN